DVGSDGFVKISALQKYMQQLAREDCNGYGATYENMRKDNIVFVITKLGMDIFEDIRSDEVISIKTISNRVEGVHFVREFLINKNGKKAAYASTYWVLLNYEKRTVVRPKNFGYPMVAYNLPLESIEVPRRLFQKNGSEYNAGIRKVVYSDLDENNHLNNCVYTDIALDVSPVDIYSYKVSKVFINFTNEARLGDILNISIIKGENSFCLNAHNDTANRACFEAELFFSKVIK
ncbi:MAG TPA: hypothetical protein DD733_01265, partial [Clostridiales bacterium]|nr:hypothetical protein [Clostridiales bacterium]